MGGIFGGSNKGLERASQRQADELAKNTALQEKDLKDKAAGAQMMQESAAARAAATQAAEDLANAQPRDKLNLDVSAPTDLMVDDTGKRVQPRQKFKVAPIASTGIKL